MGRIFVVIYILLSILLIAQYFIKLDKVIEIIEVEKNIDKPYKIKFNFKRYHIALLIIFPLSFIVFLFIGLVIPIFLYLGGIISETLRIILDCFNKPIKKR